MALLQVQLCSFDLEMVSTARGCLGAGGAGGAREVE